MKNTVGDRCGRLDVRGRDVHPADDVEAVVIDLRPLDTPTFAERLLPEPGPAAEAPPRRRRALVALAILAAGVLGVAVAPDLGASRAPSTVWQHAPSAATSWDPWQDPWQDPVQEPMRTAIQP